MFISHHSHNYIDEAGKVCHCNTDLCNVAISDHNDNNVVYGFVLYHMQVYDHFIERATLLYLSI